MAVTTFWAGINALERPRSGLDWLPTTVLQAGDWHDYPRRALTGASNRRLSVKLLDPSEISFDLPGEHPDAALLAEGISDLVWNRDGHPLCRARLTKTSHSIDETNYTVGYSATDYRGLLDRRLIMPGDGYILQPNGTRYRSADIQVTYVAGTAVELAMWDTLTNIQEQVGGSLGIKQGIWPVTGATIPLSESEVMQFGGDSTAWKVIQALTKTNSGFDFDIDPDKRANIYYPQRGGVDKGTVLRYGDTVSKVDRVVDMAQYANMVRETGQMPAMDYHVIAPDIATRPEGHWDLAFSDTNLPSTGAPTASPATVQAMAEYNYANASRLLPAYTLTLTLGTWRGPNWLWVGDIVTLIVERGQLKVREQLRVMSMTIALDSNGVETVTVEVGRPRSTMAKAWKQLSDQVTALNRR